MAHAPKWFEHVLGWPIDMTGPTGHFPGERTGAPAPVLVHVPVHLRAFDTTLGIHGTCSKMV